MKKILVLNGSLGAESGNTQVLIDHCVKFIKKNHFEAEVIHLKDFLGSRDLKSLEGKLLAASGFLFTSGTYWDSWGSPMQNFLELATDLEGSPLFLGKPASVAITMHSVGGKGILSRLQGVLNTFGMIIPPMSGMVYSLTGHLALQTGSSFAEDFWSFEDSEIIIHNMITTINNENQFKAWPTDKKDPTRVWIKEII
jgi:multimeric flavodoxin WrbA